MRLSFPAFSFLVLTGCATIIHGPNETILVRSQPSGGAASIHCDGGVAVSGTTPVKLVIPRKADNCLVEVLQGGKTRSASIARGTSGKYWTNFVIVGGVPFVAVATEAGFSETRVLAGFAGGALLGGLGFVIDHITGAAYDREVHEVMLEFDR